MPSPGLWDLSNEAIGTYQQSTRSDVKRRRLSESDIQSERAGSPSAQSRFNSAQLPKSTKPIASTKSTGYYMVGSHGMQSVLANVHARAFDSKMDVDADDDEDDDFEEEILSPVEAESIIPNYEGFKAHVRQLNPDMDSRHNWLVSRIAHQQEIRFKNLLNIKVKHCRAVSTQGACTSGRHCIATGGSGTSLHLKGDAGEEGSKTARHGSLQVVHDFSDCDSSPGEGALNDETFPIGVPMPPTRNLPAEFECQLCFKVKKIQKPSDWTKHVHEDVQPFTCTYGNCKEPKSFKRKADWVRHENERHRHLEWWICQYEDCRHQSYRKDNFLQHLVREHKFPEPKQKTKAAIEKARLTEPAWIMLEQCHHESTRKPQDEPCKFCGKSLSTWKKLTVHLARHMEHIALPILRVVEAKNVNENTMISPVEQMLSPVVPPTEIEDDVERLNMDTIKPFSPAYYSQQPAYHPNSGPLYTPTPRSEEIQSMFGPSTQFAYEPGQLKYGDGDYRRDLKFDMGSESRPSERPFPNQASISLHELSKLQGGPPLVTLPSDYMPSRWWECCSPNCARINRELHATKCLVCGHEKCASCVELNDNDFDRRQKLQRGSIGLEEQQVSHDWDVQSLASLNTFHDSALGSSLPSNTSGSLTQGLPKTAQEEILLILFSDQKFRSLLESAASLISKLRFTRNIRRLLVSFQRELHSAAIDYREKDATRIIERHSSWLASRLFDMSDPENKSNAHNMAAHLNQHIDKRPMLERYLAGSTSSTVVSNSSGASQPKLTKLTQAPGSSTNHDNYEEVENDCAPPPTPGSLDGSESDDSEIDIENYIDYSKFPNIEHIKNFILGGSAFENLKQSTFQFLNPQKPPIPSPKISPEMASEESFEGSGSTAMTEVTIPDLELEEDSDDAASIASDDPALTSSSDARILNPREYFGKLEILEREVFDDSSFLFLEGGVDPGDVGQTRALLSSEEDYHFQSLIDNDEVVRLVKDSNSRRLLHLLECYNIIRRTGRSLARLSNAGYLTDALTLLVMDRDSCRERVAQTIQIPVHKILNLGLAFEFTLKAVLAELSASHATQDTTSVVDSIVQRQAETHDLTLQCEELLNSMNMTPQPFIGVVHPYTWDCALQSLQLGVLSYAGAHLQRFDLDLIGSYVAYFELPIKITYEDEALQHISSRPQIASIKLRRRQFQCLDKLLGGCQPWVFHHSVFSEDNEPLHLSTTVGALSDIWGPSWKILGESGSITRYDIGNGSIVPWSENPDQHWTYSSTNPSEIYCHWISSKDWNEKLVEVNQCGLPRKFLLDSDILLIGANMEFGLNINPECSSSPERLSRLKTQLHNQGALKVPRTFRDKRYIDSHAVQVTGTALGIISGSGTVTYKRRVGHTMKDALVERWRHNLRSPLDLEAFSGVEVSFCTKNARRRRLMHLLSSDTMRNYLSTVSFIWVSEACEHAYFKALRCPKSFRRFWKDHREWQENVGNAISICLDALEETGIDEDNGELSALWVESFDEQGESDGESDGEDEEEPPPGAPVCQAPALGKQMDPGFCEEHIVTLFRSEHTWTGFLQDSEESLTMAIVGMTCLDFLHENGYGRRCAGQRALANDTSTSKGFAVLQTSLKLNESLLTSSKLKQEKVDSGRKTIWDAKELKCGTSFTLGSHGTLKVLTASTRTCPVIAEWSAVKSEILKEVKNMAVNERLLGRNGERHHCEYIRGAWEAKPLPVLVMSKSTKVIFTKG
ncbi:hypothetical protein V8E51_002522 [Hyaloscypha variabilis]